MEPSTFKRCSVDGCPNKHFARGYCEKHYVRVRNHGNPNGAPGSENRLDRTGMTPEERFNEKWEPVTESGCWIWTGATNSQGYGSFHFNGKVRKANRASYELFIGKIPDDHSGHDEINVCHKCGNFYCVNPDHLFLATHPFKRRVYKDLSGHVFGRLQVIGPDESSQSKRKKWLCLCQCGNTTSVTTGNLKSGKQRSCGCLYRETRGLQTKTHGGSQTREYKIWSHMRSRCTNPSSPDYRLYGERGITVCPEWSSFEQFLKDMGLCPPGYSIDRLDSNGHYEPSNCRWATPLQQGNNTSRNLIIEFQGEHRTLSQWCRHLGLPYTAVIGRINRGWTIDRAFTQKIRKVRRS